MRTTEAWEWYVAWATLDDQIKRLADYIMHNVPGEPSRSEGAVDTAIRLLKEKYG